MKHTFLLFIAVGFLNAEHLLLLLVMCEITLFVDGNIKNQQMPRTLTDIHIYPLNHTHVHVHLYIHTSISVCNSFLCRFTAHLCLSEHIKQLVNQSKWCYDILASWHLAVFVFVLLRRRSLSFHTCLASSLDGHGRLHAVSFAGLGPDKRIKDTWRCIHRWYAEANNYTTSDPRYRNAIKPINVN